MMGINVSGGEKAQQSRSHPSLTLIGHIRIIMESVAELHPFMIFADAALSPMPAWNTARGLLPHPSKPFHCPPSSALPSSLTYHKEFLHPLVLQVNQASIPVAPHASCSCAALASVSHPHINTSFLT